MKDYQDTIQQKAPIYEPEQEGSTWTFFENKESKKKSLIVIQSGIHGVETYAGSFLQQIFLKDYFEKFWTQGHSVLMIHALNNWGFHNHRRFTERGVDLNRNFDTTPDLFKTQNEKYKYARKYFTYSGKVNSPKFELFKMSAKSIWANLKERLLGKLKTDDFREALGNGQYEFPKELGYGGNKFETQVLWQQKKLPDVFKKYKKILVLDFHTGLGEKGMLHMILTGKETPEETAKIRELFDEGVKDGSYELNTGDSEGFYFTNGDYLNFVRKINPKAQVIAMAAEYGTMGISLTQQVETLSRLLLENKGHWNGYASLEARTYTQDLVLDLFAPREDAWWRSVEQKGRSLFDNSLTAMDKDW